jgi:hypothetical protein
MINVQDLTPPHIQSTHNLIKETLFTLPSYSRFAREQQITAYTVDTLQTRHINNTSRKSTIAVNTDNNQVIGFLFGYIENFNEYRMFYGEWTGVKYEYRKKSIMQQMWDYTEQFCISHKLDGFMVDTLTTNIKIHKFLQKNKMSVWAELKNHWYGHDYFLWGKFYG